LKKRGIINPKQISPPLLVLLLLLAVLDSGCGKRQLDARPRDRAGKPVSAVTALGRVTPGRAVISIAAQPGSRILKLEVTEGTKVKAGDALAYLDMYTLRKAERDAAKVALDEAWERLETEMAYAHAVVDQNREAVQLLEVAVDHERKELVRFEALLASKTVQQQRFDEQKFLVQSREGELAKAKAELRSAEAALARIRSTVGLRSAEAHLKSAEAQLELTILRAPMDGEILKILTYPGERIGDEPILKMGNTTDMHVIAEVHETDVGFVRVGQRATISSEALHEPVQGTVEEVGQLIYKNDVLNLDPRADKDTRIVEVRIKLENSETVSRLTHLEVSVRIDVGAPLAAAKSAGR
jgi:HlyD family secretion protein